MNDKINRFFTCIRSIIENICFNFFIEKPLSFYVNRINIIAAITWFIANILGKQIDEVILLTFVATMHGIVFAPNDTIDKK